jgi:predicted neuraminidase
MHVVSVSYGGWSGSAINQLVSDDGGHTWPGARRLILSPLFNLSTLVRNQPTMM